MTVVVALAVSAALSCVFTGLLIPALKKHQFKQYIREEGPKSHQKKSGTPTMGGIAIVAAIVLTALVFGGFRSQNLVMIAMMLIFGSIGFLDDFIKVSAKQNLGLRAWQKLALQILCGVLLAVYITHFTDYGTGIFIPFLGKSVDFGPFYVPFVTLVLVAMVNSVNLTDGLDGLCSGVTAIVAVFFALVGIGAGFYSESVFSAVIAGSCLGFLVFNKNPAKLFMGDTGSMALGSALAAAVILMHLEFMLIIAGFVYLMESLSVILQVISFQTTGKRIFRMSPIHHHFELGGMDEKNVVFLFWGVAFLSVLLAWLVYSL